MRSRSRKTVWSCCWAATVLVVPVLFAEEGKSPEALKLLGLEFRGRVVTVHDDWDYLEGGIQAGDPFRLNMIFDVQAIPVDRSESVAHYVQAPSTATGMSMEVAGRRFVTDDSKAWRIQVRNQNPPDRFVARADVKVPVDLQSVDWEMHSLVVTVTDDAGVKFADTSLPTSLSRDGWSQVSCVLSFVRSPHFSAIKFHPGSSVVVSGIVEHIKVLEAASSLKSGKESGP